MGYMMSSFLRRFHPSSSYSSWSNRRSGFILRSGQTRSFSSVRSCGRKSSFLSFEESHEYIKSLGFKTSTEFFTWAAADRPSFIPHRPDRVYGSQGWRGYPSWLGYGERRTGRDPEELRQNLKRGVDARNRFFHFVQCQRPDFEFLRLPFQLNANYLFRIASSNGADVGAEKSWIPLQIRLSHSRSGGRRSCDVSQVSDLDGVGIIVLTDEDDEIIAKQATELEEFRWVRKCVRRSSAITPSRAVAARHFIPRTECINRTGVCERLEVWWQTAGNRQLSELEWMTRMKGPTRIKGDSLGNGARLRRDYFDPLGIHFSRVGDLLAGYSATLGDSRIVLRSAIHQFAATGHGRFCFTMKHGKGRAVCPMSASADFDAVLVVIPPPARGADAGPSLLLEFFLFPKQFLTDVGMLSTPDQKGFQTWSLVPPFMNMDGRTAATREKQVVQEPYYVRNRDDFVRLWKELRLDRKSVSTVGLRF